MWTSADGGRTDEIEVYIPVQVAQQRITFSNAAREAAAERAIHSLRGQSALQPLAAILLRSEGIASSRIEGEVTSTRRVFEAEYAPEAVVDRQAQRIVNSIRVMGQVVADAGQGLSSEDLDRWHALLFEGDRVLFEPGAARTTQNWIGARTDTPLGAKFIPPPPELVSGSVTDLVQFVNRVDVSPLTQAAIAHAQFETIHPYPDGNGRIGRALIYRSWAYRGITAGINPPISRVLVENREGYIDGLTAYRDGDVDVWLDFFFDVIQSAVSYTHALGARLEALVGVWLDLLGGVHADSLARRLVAELNANPILSAFDVAARHGVTERGARGALDDLVERGVLTQRSFRKARRGRPAKVYEASELFSIIDLPPKELA